MNVSYQQPSCSNKYFIVEAKIQSILFSFIVKSKLIYLLLPKPFSNPALSFWWNIILKK